MLPAHTHTHREREREKTFSKAVQYVYMCVCVVKVVTVITCLCQTCYIRSSNLCRSGSLEMIFPLASLVGEIMFRFWPKTMDYNKAF